MYYSQQRNVYYKVPLKSILFIPSIKNSCHKCPLSMYQMGVISNQERYELQPNTFDK